MRNSNCCNGEQTNGLEGLATDMERVFDSLLGRTVGTVFGQDTKGTTQRFAPELDVFETEASFEVSVDLPGVALEDVQVEMHEGRLMIAGERRRKEEAEGKFHRVERSFGNFKRTLALPKDIDADGISADYASGVLTVSIPKSEKPQPRKIEIRTSSN